MLAQISVKGPLVALFLSFFFFLKKKKKKEAMCSETCVQAWQFMVARPVDIRPYITDSFPNMAICEVSKALNRSMDESEIFGGWRWGLPDMNHFETFLNFLWQIFDILPIRRGQQNSPHSGP